METKEKPLVTNTDDVNQVKAAEKKEKYKRDQFDEDMKFLLDTDQGKRVFWDYLGYCKILGECFTGNSETFYNLGMQNVGRKMYADITRANPEAYIQMMMKQGEN